MRTMELAELQHLAKYPFLRKSREYVASLNLSFEDILQHPIYSAALDLGRKRVLDCLDGRYRPEYDDRLTAELTILSYPVARMLAHTVGRTTAFKHASGEADAAYRLLKNEDDGVVDEISRDLGVMVEGGVMPLVQYTKLAAGLSRQNQKWKLSNRVVYEGKVEVESGEVRALLQEAVKNRVMEAVDTQKIPDEVKKLAKNMKGSLTGTRKTIEIDYLEEDAIGPCIKGMLSDLEAGMASHTGMFILATFFHNLGLKKEDILGIFARSPKYDEEKALYQLEFLTGERGGTEYTCPTCATIKSYGLCRDTCNVKHPLQYYRQHAKRKPKVIKKKKNK